MEGDSLVDFNFWPSFADLMLATVFVLVLVIVLVAFAMQIGSVNIEAVQQEQQEMVREIQAEYGDSLQVVSEGEEYVVWKDGRKDIRIYNDLDRQRITFSDNVLFAPDQYALKAGGRAMLADVGRTIKSRLSSIYKINIEGHTDTVPTYKFEGGNLELGAMRALSVFEFLKDEVGINPARSLMSATSFGQYKPVQRAAREEFSEEEIADANATDDRRSRNRRVELLIFYRQN